MCSSTLLRFCSRAFFIRVYSFRKVNRKEKWLINANKSNSRGQLKCDTEGAYTPEPLSVYGELVHGIENFGRSQYQDRAAPTGALLGRGNENRQAAAAAASAAAAARLFDDIGKSLCVPEQADGAETEDEASSMERPTPSSPPFRSERRYSRPLFPQNLCCHTEETRAFARSYLKGS